jgi:AcrR family transcriptional regulator
MAQSRRRPHEARTDGPSALRRGRRARGDVRAQILEAATRLLAARGFEGTTLQAVADEVKIRKPSVLHHFESKEALRAGVIDDILAHWSRLVPQLLRSATERKNPFVEIMRELTAFFIEDPDRARLLIREALDRPTEFRALFHTHVHPWIAMFAGGVREGQRRGIYRDDADPEEYLAHMLQLIVVGIGNGDVLSDPTSGDARARQERRLRELLRIARSSLMKDSAAPRAPRGAG